METQLKNLKMLSGMMFFLRKTRPETHSTALNENSKIMNYKFYSEMFTVWLDPEESKQTMFPSNDPKLG